MAFGTAKALNLMEEYLMSDGQTPHQYNSTLRTHRLQWIIVGVILIIVIGLALRAVFRLDMPIVTLISTVVGVLLSGPVTYLLVRRREH